MAMKLKPMRRSLVTHERIIKPNVKMAEFIYDLFEGKIDEDIDKMMNDIPEKAVNAFPPIQSLLDDLKSRLNGDLEHDLYTMNQFLNHHDEHPHSLKILQAISHGLDGAISQETVDAFRDGILANIVK